MRIGVFDSGIGGLIVARAIVERLPQYDYLYLGDTKRVPYGNRSQATVHEFTSQALAYLFQNDCQIVILACNTASAEALRKSQQEYLPTHYPDRRVLGVVIPMAEAAVEAVHPEVGALRSREGRAAVASRATFGVLATASTCESRAYSREIEMICSGAKVIEQPAPLLVPLVENDGLKYAGPILDDYLAPLADVDSLVLGCTHYAALKNMIRGKTARPVISPDEVVPEKLADYLERHPELEAKLSRGGSRRYEVTDLTDSYAEMAQRLVGSTIDLVLTELNGCR